MAVVGTESCDSLPLEEEPKLKYHRMVNDVLNILVKDAISCIAVHPKFVCVGSQWGVVHLLDHEGNTVCIAPQELARDKGLHAHTIAVNNISVDCNGDYIATCSDDGKVIVHGLYSTENNHNLSLGRVIKSIALDPNYHKPGSGRRFLIGDNKLTLYEKSFLNRVKSTVLCECEGYVQAVAWQDRFVAWASDVGVRVYDLVARCSLGLIKWERSKVSIEEYRCNLVWAADKTLMIGWVDTVRICVVRKRSSLELQTRAVPEYLVDPMCTFQTEYYICGLAPLDNQLVLLGFPKEVDPKTGKAQRPILNIVDYKESEFADVSSDTLNIRGYEEYSCNEYHLASVIEENRFFIVSPKDIVIASQYDIDDKVQWLVDHDFYERAMTVLENAGGKTTKHTVSSVGILHMDRLIENSDYEQAAKLCSKVCSADRTLWEEQVYKFSNMNRLRSISPYIPKSLDRKLGAHIYEMILYEYLKFDPQGFLLLVQEWNPLLYNINAVVKAVIEQLLLTDVDKSYYMESLAVLYCHQRKYDKALSMYLKLQHEDVFKLIKQHNLYNFIHDKILALMKLDCDKAIAMLLDKIKVPVEIIEDQLKSHNFYLYRYLDSLSKVDTNGKYHGKLVKLYANFAREKLLPFLRSSDNYPIQDALDVCKECKFYPETVYLLGRIGSTKDALNIIIEDLKDINQAITFCQEHDDRELWLDLITHSLDKPEFITLLLKRIGNYVDPRVLIKGIKPGCEIVDLKDSLGKMMGDYNLQLSVQDACKAITLRNYFDLHEKLIKGHRRGICISDEYLCSACHGKIIIKDLSHASDMIIYNCRHTFHLECLPEALQNGHHICALCNPVKI